MIAFIKNTINIKNTLFVISAMCSIILSLKETSAAQVPASTPPSCADLKYTTKKTDSWKCYDKYFSCPLDPNYIKCDRMAKVGDIKYTKSATANKGWLLCDGSTYDATKYSELKNLIGQKFGNSGYKLPNYIGVFLRGAGSQRVGGTTYTANSTFYTIQESDVKAHNHSYISHYFNVTRVKEGDGTWNGSSDIIKPSTGRARMDASGSNETCPMRVGLYPYIYAGEPAKK